MAGGGLWHGANWTFVIWGGLHAVYQTVAFVKNKIFGVSTNCWWVVALQILLVNICVIFAWIFFRATSFEHANKFIGIILDGEFIRL